MANLSGEKSAVGLARAFVDDVVRPTIREWERGAVYPRTAVRNSGLTGLFAPAEDGGLELALSEAVAVFEELGRGDAALAFSMSMHNAVTSAVTRSGDHAVRTRWAKPLVAGDALGGFSLTEPHAGSDASAITTLATSRDGRWTLRGQKAWVTLGGEADLFLVFAKTSEDPGPASIAMFMVETSSPGVSFGAPYSKAASDFLPITDMELRDAPGHLLVPPGQGLRAGLAAIDVARFDIAAIANGLHAEALDVATRYAMERSVFGKPVLQHLSST